MTDDHTDTKWVHGRKLAHELGLCAETLRRWANKGRIQCYQLPNSGTRMYDADSVRKLIGLPTRDPTQQPHRLKALYARVSSIKQRGDLERQIQRLQSDGRDKAHGYKLYKDIGSGLNFQRKGFKALLDACRRGLVEEVVVTHRDRLARFAVDHLVDELKAARTKLVVLGNPRASGEEEPDGRSPGELQRDELQEDLLAITTFFVSRYHGQRSGAAKRKRKRKESPGTASKSQKKARAASSH